MYAQITTLCNMECPHCCYSCGPSKPFTHMTRRIYDHCLELCEATGSTMQLGGGEPTCHPEFWEFLKAAINSECEHVWLATNGLIKQHCILIAELAGPHHETAWHEMWDIIWDDDGETIKSEIPDWRIDGTNPDDWEKFSATLSVDPYHDPIHDSVRQAFAANSCELRDNSSHISNSGAAMTNGLGEYHDCCCEEIHIKPDGSVQLCGCDDSLQLGHITDYTTDTWGDLIQLIHETEDQHHMCGYYGMKDSDGMYQVELARTLTSIMRQEEAA